MKLVMMLHESILDWFCTLDCETCSVIASLANMLALQLYCKANVLDEV